MNNQFKIKKHSNMYKLINNKTKEETICSLVTIDGFNYYVSEEKPIKNTYFIEINNNGTRSSYTNKIYFCDIGETDNFILTTEINFPFPENCKKVIATNNPNIDIPKVIDEELTPMEKMLEQEGYVPKGTFKVNTKETYQFTEKDMIKFLDFCLVEMLSTPFETSIKGQDKLLSIWKEQKPKILYYE